MRILGCKVKHRKVGTVCKVKQKARMNESAPFIDIAIQDGQSNCERTKLPSARGTHKGHNTTLELDKRHLTFLVGICYRRNCYRGADNLRDTTGSDYCARVCTFAVRVSLSMHDAGLSLALLRFRLTISVARMTMP